MSRNKQRPNRYSNLRTAVFKREQLLREQNFSADVQTGEAVIFTSGQTKEDKAVLAEHAEKLSSDPTRIAFIGATIVRQSRPEDVIQSLLNRDVCSMAFLGDGNFGTFNMFVDGHYERVTWDKLAKSATHLKQGVLSERTCSAILLPTKEVRVSLSSLIVVDQTTIEGTVEKTFANHAGFETFNHHLGPIYPKASNDIEELRRPIGFDLL